MIFQFVVGAWIYNNFLLTYKRPKALVSEIFAKSIDTANSAYSCAPVAEYVSVLAVNRFARYNEPTQS